MSVGINDLKLLVDAEHATHAGAAAVSCDHGFGAAAERLVRAGYLERDPSAPALKHVVRITLKGQQIVDRLECLLRNLTGGESRVGERT